MCAKEARKRDKNIEKILRIIFYAIFMFIITLSIFKVLRYIIINIVLEICFAFLCTVKKKNFEEQKLFLRI